MNNGKKGLLTTKVYQSAILYQRLHQCLLLALFIMYFLYGNIYANPMGTSVINGTVSFANTPHTLTITNTPHSIINWQSFSINTGETTVFVQQNAASSVLNRIVGQNPSEIFGTLESNGKIYLINPNGILFGPNSQVNVAGLVASTLPISNADFLAGNNVFGSSSGPSTGLIINTGAITTPSGGNIYLIAPEIANAGILTSPQGEIILAAGHSVTLVDSSNLSMQVVISAPTEQAINLGQIIATAGKIGIYGGLIHQDGIVNADSAVLGESGEVFLKSSTQTKLAGNSQTSANSSSGLGGTVDLLGPKVTLSNHASINANGQTGGGTILIGGDFSGTNSSIPNANKVFVGKNVTINANALEQGNGGNISIWSEDATQFYGHLSAQGVQQGGYAEIASNNYLSFKTSAVNLSTSQGLPGTLLLGANQINIDNSSNSAHKINTLSTINANLLNNQLSNSNVVIQATATPNSTITVSTASSSNADQLNWNSNNSLSLLATSNITIQAPISASSATLNLNSSKGNISQTAPINTAQLSAIAGVGNVTLSNANNKVNTISGNAGGTGGFTFNDSSGFNINQISSSKGDINLTASSGNITDNQSINAVSNNIYISALNGSILQAARSPATITTTGQLTLQALNDIGSNGVGNALLTNVGSLIIPHADNVYLSNNSSNLTLNKILATGNTYLSTIGNLTIPITTDTTNFTGSSITLLSSKNFLIGSGNIFSTTNGNGTVNLYAGYNAANGSSPVANGSKSTLTQGGIIKGASINLFANAYNNFLGNAAYSSTPTYSPGPPSPAPNPVPSPIPGPIPIPTPAPIPTPTNPSILIGLLPSTNYLVGLNSSNNYLLSNNQFKLGIDDEIKNSISCN